MSTRVVTIAYDAGPLDGWAQPYRLGAGQLMPLQIDRLDDGTGYELDRFDTDAKQWRYRWDPARTGRRNPCQAGADVCPGGRCPSGRSPRTHSP